jgi:PIN domain nuclease of toxin-antitoxin system
MRLLLDTGVLLWLMEGNPRLDEKAHELIDNAIEVYFSSASIWEIAVKARLGKIEVDAKELVEQAREAGLIELPVTARHTVAAAQLPLLHRDPFDRLLVAQALVEPLRLVSGNVQRPMYSELIVRV